MRIREATVPILLWVVTANAVHWIGGEESDHIATLQEGKKKLHITTQTIIEDQPPMETFIFDPAADPAIAKMLEVPAAAESAAPTDPADPPEAEKKDKEKEKPKDKEKE